LKGNIMLFHDTYKENGIWNTDRNVCGAKASFYTAAQTDKHSKQRKSETAVFFVLLFFFICAAGCFTSLRAQDMPISVRVHVALLKKVFSFNRNLQSKPSPKVTIVFTDASVGVKDDALKAFTEIGIPVTALKLEQALKALGEADVVYVAPGAAAIQKVCDERGILTITGIPSLVETGKVAVGIGAEGGKPKVYVNVSVARVQKQELSSELLRVSRVFQ
jgi:hypothetical protein